jgi:uncharacterized membrane protein
MKRLPELLLNFFSSKRLFYVTFAIVAINWVGLAIFDYYFAGFRTWDTGAHAQPIANLAVNGVYWDNYNRMHPLYNHFRIGLLAFLPLFYIVPSALWIVFTKIASFLICPLIFLKMGRKYLKNQQFLYVIPTFWLINDVLINTQAAENQGTAIILPFILLAFFYAFEGKLFKMFLNLGLILLFKENMAIIWVAVGFFLLVEKKQTKLGVGLIFSGIGIGLFLTQIVMPMYSHLEVQYYGKGDEFGPFEMIPLKLLMLFKALLAVAFIPLIHPKSLLYGFAAFGLYLASKDQRFIWLNYHHHDYTFTVLFTACFFSIKAYLEGRSWFSRVTLSKQKKWAAFAALGLFIAGATKLPLQDTIFEDKADYHMLSGLRKEALIYKETIPNDVKVFVPENLGIYFIDLPKVDWIDYGMPLNEMFSKDRSFIIYFPKHKRSSLSSIRAEHYERIKERAQLEASSTATDHQGQFKIVDAGENLSIFVYNKNK